MNNNTITGYRVSFTITVDCPERRDASFTPVEAGTKIHSSWHFDSQGAAVRCFDGMLAGEEDYSSEYVSKCSVERMYAGRSPRCIRRPVERNPRTVNGSRWTFNNAPAIPGVSHWTLTDGTPVAYCKTCKADLVAGTCCQHVNRVQLDNLLATIPDALFVELVGSRSAELVFFC